MFPNRVGRIILDGVVDPIGWAQKPLYLQWSGSSMLCCTMRKEILIYFLLCTGAIADVNLVHDEFTRSCAQAGPKYCAIATGNSTQADIAAWLQNLMDFAFDHPFQNITSALVRST